LAIVALLRRICVAVFLNLGIALAKEKAVHENERGKAIIVVGVAQKQAFLGAL
jgi:hypothetical protein